MVISLLKKTSMGIIVGFTLSWATVITPSKQKVGEFSLIIREYRGKLLIFAFNKQKGVPPTTKLQIFSPTGMIMGGKIFRGEGVYYLVPKKEGIYQVILAMPGRKISFKSVKVVNGDISHDLNLNSSIQIQYIPKIVDVGQNGIFLLKVITPPSITKVVMEGIKSHLLTLKKATYRQKEWEWRADFQPNEVAPGGRKMKRVKIVVFSKDRPVGEKIVSFPIVNSSRLTPPVPPAVVNYIVRTCASNYRYRGGHLGTDFVVPAGTPVYAVCPGIVKLEAGRYRSSQYDHNAVIIIEHQCNGRRFFGYYGHTKGVVSNGQPVREGQVIGFIQNGTGDIPSHLHFGFSNRFITTHWGIGTTPNCWQELKKRGFWSSQELFNFANWKWAYRK